MVYLSSRCGILIALIDYWCNNVIMAFSITSQHRRLVYRQGVCNALGLSRFGLAEFLLLFAGELFFVC